MADEQDTDCSMTSPPNTPKRRALATQEPQEEKL